MWNSIACCSSACQLLFGNSFRRVQHRGPHVAAAEHPVDEQRDDRGIDGPAALSRVYALEGCGRCSAVGGKVASIVARSSAVRPRSWPRRPGASEDDAAEDFGSLANGPMGGPVRESRAAPCTAARIIAAVAGPRPARWRCPRNTQRGSHRRASRRVARGPTRRRGALFAEADRGPSSPRPRRRDGGRARPLHHGGQAHVLHDGPTYRRLRRHSQSDSFQICSAGVGREVEPPRTRAMPAPRNVAFGTEAPRVSPGPGNLSGTASTRYGRTLFHAQLVRG